MKYLMAVMIVVSGYAVYASSFRVKKTVLGSKTLTVFVSSLLQNDDGTATLTIVACGTQLEFTEKLEIMEQSKAFEQFADQQIAEACR